MANWKRIFQEPSGVSSTYLFNGKISLTETVCRFLSLEEIIFISSDLIKYANEQKGIGNRQIYQDETGREIELIDNKEKSISIFKFINEV